VQTSDLRRLAQSLTRRQFMDKHQHQFLVLNAGADVEGLNNVFATQAAPHLAPAGSEKEMTLLSIAKSAGNPFQSHVSVGRARNCDLVIRHRSVSKLHARFRVDEATLKLSDAGSQNGTFVNGKRLLPNEVVEIRSSDQLVFGSVAARTLDAEAVYELLRQ
jgi:hypothetical protein